MKKKGYSCEDIPPMEFNNNCCNELLNVPNYVVGSKIYSNGVHIGEIVKIENNIITIKKL